jgi:BirA family biotin operon repressor/biotin-[acetyl-CoA-carboxylase] ligase
VAITLAPGSVRPRLEGRFGSPLYLYAERCSSTQDLLPLGAPEGALALAEEQTHGRGRRGRDWQGTAAKSLLFSLCLHPAVETAQLASLTPVAAEAIAEAIVSFGGEAAVKHPNDVLLSGRKVAGILAEASDGRVALGVGVNVEQKASDLPARPVFPATSLALELGRPIDRVELLVCILVQLERHYEHWLTETAAWPAHSPPKG